VVDRATISEGKQEGEIHVNTAAKPKQIDTKNLIDREINHAEAQGIGDIRE
jgi:hypothetical protein